MSIYWHAEEGRLAHPAEITRDKVFKKVPSLLFSYDTLLQHSVRPEDAQRPTCPHQLCKIRDLIYDCVVLCVSEQVSPQKRQRLDFVMAIDNEPQALPLCSSFILADVFLHLSDSRQQRQGSLWWRQSQALCKRPRCHFLSGNSPLKNKLPDQPRASASKSSGRRCLALLLQLSLGWVFPQTPNPSEFCHSLTPWRHKKGSNAHCCGPSSPCPAAPSEALRRSHPGPELSRIGWAVRLSSLAGGQGFVYCSQSKLALLPPWPVHFFENIKHLAQSYHFLLSSVRPKPMMSGQWPEPAPQGQHCCAHKCTKDRAQQGQRLARQSSACSLF